MNQQVVHPILTQQQPENLTNDPFPLQTDLRKRLRQLERQTPFLLSNKRFSEASALIQSMVQKMKEYYRIVPSVSKNMQAIRTINKLKKKEELILIHNQAVVYYKANSHQQAIQQITVIIQEIVNIIQSQQTKYGFLLQNQQSQRKIIIESINGWQQHLVKYYYFLAQITKQNEGREIAVASLMKGLDLIKELYRFELKIIKQVIDNEKIDKNETYAHYLCNFQQIQQLYLLCQLRDKVSYSKYLNIVSINTLIETASRLFDINKPIEPNSAQFNSFQLTHLIELQLPPLQQIISSQYISNKSINHVSFNKTAQFIYYDLISKIESQKNKDANSDYQKLKHTKNIILLHIFEGIIYHYLPLCPKIHQILQQYSQMYKSKSKSNQRNQVNIYKLIDIFGLTPQNVTEHSLDDLSIIQTNQNHRKNKIQKDRYEKSKQKGKQQQIKKKSQSKSAGKQKVKKEAVKLNENKTKQQKERKERVKNEYKLKDKKMVKPAQDHLTKAISQKYLTFDNSLSKDKNIPVRKRSIRTQTCIAMQRDKIKKVKINK